MVGVKQVTFSLAKLMPIAFTRNSSWSTNGIRGSSANYFQCLPVELDQIFELFVFVPEHFVFGLQKGC